MRLWLVIAEWLLTLAAKWGLIVEWLLTTVIERLLAATCIHAAILRTRLKQGKVINHDFGHVNPLALLVFVVPRLDAAIDPHQ